MRNLIYYITFSVIVILMTLMCIFMYASQVREEKEDLINTKNKLQMRNEELERDNYILKREIGE